MLFADKVALVTGGASGIGRACALEFARGGASVAVVDVAGGDASAETARLAREAGARVVCFEADVADFGKAERIVAETRVRLGGLDLLVNAAGTPAYDQGLYAADQIVAVDGARASLTFLNARLEEKRPGDELRLTVFRADELRTLTIKLGGRPEENYRIAPVRNPTPEQMRLYEAWLGAPFPKS